MTALARKSFMPLTVTFESGIPQRILGERNGTSEQICKAPLR